MEKVLREEEPRRVPWREGVELTGIAEQGPDHQGLTQASQSTGSRQWAPGDSRVKAAFSPETVCSARKCNLWSLPK